MRRMIIAATVLVALIALAGCDAIGDKQVETVTPAAVPPVVKTPVAAPKTFTPPADSSISERVFGTWKECGVLLDSLTYFYADSFKTADAVRMLRLQEDFMKAKDKLCRRAGLPGGFDEYKWVSQSLSNPRNKKYLTEDAFF